MTRLSRWAQPGVTMGSMWPLAYRMGALRTAAHRFGSALACAPGEGDSHWKQAGEGSVGSAAHLREWLG